RLFEIGNGLGKERVLFQWLPLHLVVGPHFIDWFPDAFAHAFEHLLGRQVAGGIGRTLVSYIPAHSCFCSTSMRMVPTRPSTLNFSSATDMRLIKSNERSRWAATRISATRCCFCRISSIFLSTWSSVRSLLPSVACSLLKLIE